MAQCPICGLAERCRNHWIATQEAGGEIEFQTGPMTASDDNLILLQNKLNRPDLRGLLAKINLEPAWVTQGERASAYLAWPLELRAAVNRALFPNGIPGGDRPVPPTPIFRHTIEEINLIATRIDTEQCLPDELLYGVEFEILLKDFGAVRFEYLQVVWDELAPWAELVAPPKPAEQARQTLRLMFTGLLDVLRARFAGQLVDVLCEDCTEGLTPGGKVDEVALVEAAVHLGEEIERHVNERRIQPLLRDAIMSFGLEAKLP